MLSKLLQWFKRGRAKEFEEWAELKEDAFKAEGAYEVKIERLTEVADVERIRGWLREGKICLVRIREIREKNVAELKRCIERLRKTCLALNGDIVGVNEDFLILTPQIARVYRGRVERAA